MLIWQYFWILDILNTLYVYYYCAPYGVSYISFTSILRLICSSGFSTGTLCVTNPLLFYLKSLFFFTNMLPISTTRLFLTFSSFYDVQKRIENNIKDRFILQIHLKSIIVTLKHNKIRRPYVKLKWLKPPLQS